MANGSPATTFDKALEAVKQLGMPIVVAGVLLWFMITKLDAALTRLDTAMEGMHALMSEARVTQLESRQTQQEMRQTQLSTIQKVDAWLAQACRPGSPSGAIP